MQTTYSSAACLLSCITVCISDSSLELSGLLVLSVALEALSFSFPGASLSSACSWVAISFGVRFFSEVLDFEADLGVDDSCSFDFNLDLTISFVLCIPIVVLGSSVLFGAFPCDESSSLSMNSWLNAAFAGATKFFDFALEYGKGTGVLFDSFMVSGWPCSMRHL